MRTYTYVEDYIQVIAGAVDPVTLTSKKTIFWEFAPIISLARYDVDVMRSMNEQICNNTGLTERQAGLATKIILKYRRQLANLGIDVTPIEHPEFKLAIRKVDYSETLYLGEDYIALKFPYRQSRIDELREFGKISEGQFHWDRDDKVWRGDLSEFNVNWIYSWAKKENFNIAQEVEDMFVQILECEAQGYAIELCINDGVVTIKNAADSLLDYIRENVGELNLDNLLTLIDYSAILGYTVSQSLLDTLATEYGDKFVQLISQRNIKINPDTVKTSSDVEEILKYAERVNRLPVYIYEPDLSNRLLDRALEYVGENQCHQVGNKTQVVVGDNIKVIHTIKPIELAKGVPLLISSAGLVFGGAKQVMIQKAEKVVFCAKDVYNKSRLGVESIAG